MATRVSSPVLIGRDAELGALLAAWEAAVDGRPTTVLVGGEAGIGKSRLVAELARAVRDDGGLVLEGASISLGDDEGLPLAPIADALRALARQLPPESIQDVVGSAGPALGRLLPELGGAVDASEAATRRRPERLCGGPDAAWSFPALDRGLPRGNQGRPGRGRRAR